MFIYIELCFKAYLIKLNIKGNSLVVYDTRKHILFESPLGDRLDIAWKSGWHTVMPIWLCLSQYLKISRNNGISYRKHRRCLQIFQLIRTKLPYA